MRTLTPVTLALLLLAGTASADDLADRAASSRAAAQAFGASLKQALQQAIQAGGPVNGITVCRDMAPTIAATIAKERGLAVVGRTSLHVRNPENAPDDWELDVLQQFAARKAAGEPAEALEHYEIEEHGNAKTFRYMKAIPTAELCLVCHGEQIPPAVKAKLAELYPDDTAVDFKAGDLRGAFTISHPLAGG